MKKIVAVLLILVVLFAFIPNAQATDATEETMFSIVWISDTQNMVYHNFPNSLESMNE